MWYGGKKFPVVAACAAGLALAFVSIAGATETDMAQLPVAAPYLCLACHTESNPTPVDHELNVFGLDFLDNGRVWDAELAQIDSDGDGCLNGVEIGDSDGDGISDGNVTQQSGNPGVADDCGSGSLVDEKTWSQLKALFDGDR